MNTINKRILNLTIGILYPVYERFQYIAFLASDAAPSGASQSAPVRMLFSGYPVVIYH